MEKKKKFSKSAKKGLTSAFLYGIMFTEQNERGIQTMTNNDYINATASIFDFYTEEDWNEFFMACELDDVLDSIVREYGHEAHITIKAFEKAEKGATAEELKSFIKYYEEA